MKKKAQDRLDVITRQIQDLRFSEALGIAESQSSIDLAEWDLREEIYWKQKARVDWLQEGDKNTAFFHKSVQARRNRSYISSLVTSDGTHLTSSQAISREAIQFYSAPFLDDLPPAEIEENTILSCIPSLVTREMNDSLMGQLVCLTWRGWSSAYRRVKLLGLMASLLNSFKNFGILSVMTF